METLQYTEAHLEYRNRLREFLDREVTPRIEQWESDHIVPREVWRKMGESGFLCNTVPMEYGGMGGDFLYSVITTEEMLRTNHLGLMSPLHSDIIVPYIQAYGTEEQKRKYLPGCVTGEIITAVAMTEPDAGSDLASMTATAVQEGNEVVINGAKTFISNGINCGLVVLAARDPAVAPPHRAISLYLVEEGTAGFVRGQKLEKMGMHSQDTAELFFTNCRIPVENRLGEEGAGFIMLMQKLQQERLVCAVMCQARAEWMLEWTVDYCRNRESGDGKPLGKLQSNQFALAEMATEISVSRAFVDKLVAGHTANRDVGVETSMAKYWTSDMAKSISERCMDLVGAFALDERCPLARAFRDLPVTSAFAGTNEIMKGLIGKSLGL